MGTSSRDYLEVFLTSVKYGDAWVNADSLDTTVMTSVATAKVALRIGHRENHIGSSNDINIGGHF